MVRIRWPAEGKGSISSGEGGRRKEEDITQLGKIGSRIAKKKKTKKANYSSKHRTGLGSGATNGKRKGGKAGRAEG